MNATTVSDLVKSIAADKAREASERKATAEAYRAYMDAMVARAMSRFDASRAS